MKNKPQNYRGITLIILTMMTLIAVGMGFASAYHDEQIDWRGMFGNISAELFGGVVTFVVLDRVIGGRERREEQQHSQQVMQINTVEELEFADNSQKKNVIFKKINQLGLSSGMTLRGTYLRDVNISYLKLPGIIMLAVHLEQANMEGANLQHSTLFRARLDNANLSYADLEEADLGYAHFEGAQLAEANLKNARHLESAHFSETSLLPDRTLWSPGVDLLRFTDPNHARFWRSSDPKSPAYEQ